MKYNKIKKITEIEPKDIFYLSVKTNHNYFANNICVHNCGYRGNLAVKMYNFTGDAYMVKKGDKICQFKVERVYETVVEFTDTIVEAARGANGFGSSGK
jgi:dUTP pyrophosphatase